MQVFIDGRMLYKSGIGRYIRNIVRETMVLKDDLDYLIAGDLEQINYYRREEIPDRYRKAIKAIPYNQEIYSWGEQLSGSYLARRKANNDIVFFPHYNAPYYLPANSAVTIHDLIHFKLAHDFNRPQVLLARQVLKNAVKKAGRIITVSQSTRQDLMEMFPAIDEEKISVIYHGVSDRFRAAEVSEIEKYKKKRGLHRYLLFIGNRKPHKNLGRLVEAYAGLIKEIPDLQLVIGGEKFAAGDEVDLLKQKYQLDNLLEFTDLHDNELSLIYSGAEALVLPSLYEGFGLPVLEAMQCRTPVILSRCSSLPEVAGDAGVYFDPYDIEAIQGQIYKVLKDQTFRDSLVKQGLEQVKKFTWDRAAAETLQVFREISAAAGRSK